VTGAVPDAAIAAELAEATVGIAPVAVTRFTTGSQHFVYEARFAGRDPVVVRISRPEHRWLVRNASKMSRQLRPLGVPLPEMLAGDAEAPLPYMILARLPGTDLGDVIDTLNEPQLAAIATEVARAQAIVAQTSTAGRFGYAADPADAPRQLFSELLADSILRSRGRITAADLYDLAPVEAAEAVLADLRSEADDMPATPFLHDTTTKNVIVAPDGRFSGIVDVDDLCFGDPRAPLALTTAAIMAFRAPSPYAALWMEQAGHRDDRLFRFEVALCLLDFMSEEGQVFNGNERPSSPDIRARLQRLYEAELARAR